jgi:hypothetical protein
MKLKTFITAFLLFSATLAVAAEEGVYELFVADIRLPISANGSVSHRTCPTECNYRSAQFAVDAQFEVNGQPTDYDGLRNAFGRAARGADVTVLYDKENRRINLVSIYVAD